LDKLKNIFWKSVQSYPAVQNSPSLPVLWTQEYDQEDSRMHCYVEHCKIIVTPMNSNKFIEFDMKK